MRELKFFFNMISFLMLGTITGSIVYLALWFKHYEHYIL